jgi:tellurite resistance protein TerC
MSWLNAAWEGHFPIAVSLGVIIAILGGSIALSLVLPVSNVPEKDGR